MKLFAIRDEKNRPGDDLGYLLYYPKRKKFFIELADHAVAEDLPILLASFCRKGIRTIGSDWSRRFVAARIIPYERQNIEEILSENDLPDYDEYQILTMTGGSCCQDDILLFPMEESHLSMEMTARLRKKLLEVTPIAHSRTVIAVFRNGIVKRADLSVWERKREFTEIFQKDSLFADMSVEVGGNGILWGKEPGISAEELYSIGQTLAISADEMDQVAFGRMMDTAQACSILNCSRQYLDQLVKKGKLRAHRTAAGRMLFRRYDIDRLFEI